MLSLFSQFIFGSSKLFNSDGSAGSKLASSSWRDRSLCFDLRQSEVELNFGEQLIGCFFPIEDIKGNQDEMGLLKVTNLRLIWICCSRKRVNLSIGWRTVSLAFEQNLKNSLGNSVTSFCIISIFDSTKYEFVFNKMEAHNDMWNGEDNWWNFSNHLRKYAKQNDDKLVAISHLSPMYLHDPFEVVLKIWQCYKQTSLFRHCRANLTNMMPKDSSAQDATNMRLEEYCKLPGEETIDIYREVIQLESRSVKYNGSLILTSVRLIWIDQSLPLKNLSIPYIRVDSMKLKQNRIFIKTLDYLATSNQIELFVERSEGLTETKLMFEQMRNLYTLYRAKPRFGPESCEESLNYMSHLRPIEYYLAFSPDGSTMQNVENFGPEMNVTYPTNNLDVNRLLIGEQASRKTKEDDEEAYSNIEIVEKELSRYKVKLNSYLNEQPIERDKEIMYSKDLGLAFERPTNDLDLDRIWRIEL